MLYWYFY